MCLDDRIEEGYGSEAKVATASRPKAREVAGGSILGRLGAPERWDQKRGRKIVIWEA